MADDSSGDRTEQPTARRLDEAKEKGNVAQSKELNSAIIMLTAMITLKASAGYFARTINRFFVTTYHESSLMEITIQTLPGQMHDYLEFMAMLLLPVLSAITVAAVVSNVGQIGFMVAKKAIKPDFQKLSPLNGIKKMFSARSLVEMLKGILKIVVLGFIGYWILKKYEHGFLMLSNLTALEIFSFLGGVLFDLSLKVGIALLIMAAGDFAYQRYAFIKSLKMSKQEVKDETKQYEGDPKVKKRLRSKQFEMGLMRMMQELPEATVVVTNPTHLAVALKYDPKSSADAPKVVAKGKDKLAERIKKVAKEHDIPILENKPLARGLFEACEVGMEIPLQFYQAVAEILSQVYQKNKSKIPLLGELNG